MNLMHIILSSPTATSKTKKYGARNRVELGRKLLAASHLKISDQYTKFGETLYYYNCLPLITKARDVLKKPLITCKLRVNWKQKKFLGESTVEEYLQLKEQWGWCATIVDTEHTRNKYKNKEMIWAVFDTKEKADKALNAFNTLFVTAMEQDAVDEYKRFKENPEKRVLSFDKILPTAYELYEAVDNGEM